MTGKSATSRKMRIYHRYLGYFLAGIMAVYSLSGIILIFRDTDFLKKEKLVEKDVAPNLSAENLGREIRIRDLKFQSESGDMANFKQGAYNKASGHVQYSVKSLPKVLEKLTQLHKANTKDPLFFLNVFFGVSLFFFVLSSFWMFLPRTTIFRKGLYFTAAGIILTLIMIFMK